MKTTTKSENRLPTRILIIKLWALGDILMATPMLKAIRAKSPDAYIAWLIDSNNAEILNDHPEINELIPIDTGHWRRLRRRGKILDWLRMTKEIQGQLNSRRFDAVINGQAADWWSVFFCAAPIKIGLAWFKRPFWHHYYSYVMVKRRLSGLHNTDHFLQATTALGYIPSDKQMSIGETVEEQAYMDELKLTFHLEKGRRVIVIAPFSTSENRSIPTEYIVQLINWISSNIKADILLVSEARNRERVKTILELSDNPTIVNLDNISLREYISIVRNSDLIITVDSSPMHLASAVGTPYIALFGPTPMNERVPITGKGIVLSGKTYCSPCDLPTCSNAIFQECIFKITFAEISDAVKEMLSAACNTNGNLKEGVTS